MLHTVLGTQKRHWTNLSIYVKYIERLIALFYIVLALPLALLISLCDRTTPTAKARAIYRKNLYMSAESSLVSRLFFAKVPVRSAPHRDFHFHGLCSSHSYAALMEKRSFHRSQNSASPFNRSIAGEGQRTSVNCIFPTGVGLENDKFGLINHSKTISFPPITHIDWEG